MEEQMVSGGQPQKNPATEGTTLEVIQGAKPSVRATEATKRLKENYLFFGPVTALYAIFYAFCMYKNASGVTFPFFVASTLCYFYFTLKKLEITLKSGSVFYAVSVMLLSIATFCTDDARIIVLNKTGIFLLTISFLISQFFDVSKWGFGKYVSSIVTLLASALEELPRPVSDMSGFTKKDQSPKTRNVILVLLGLLFTIPIFLLVGALLSSADVFFRQITDKIVAFVNLSNVLGVMVRIVLWYFGTYMIVAKLCKKSIREDVTDHRHGEPILAITVTSMLSLMYLVFSGIQIFGLFLGQLRLPDGYTYAAYAREGFFQLLAVSILNLIIVLICMAFFKESKILKAVLTVMSLCTFIMIASSAMRMILYVSTYDLTFLRIIVLWALAVLFLLFIGVVASIFRMDFPLFRYGVAVVTVFYIALAFSHPDYICAKYNLEYSAKQPVDIAYLNTLSADAAPVLLPYLEQEGIDTSTISNRSWPEDRSWRRFLSHMSDVYEENQSIRHFNLSRYWALRNIK
ncbi:MAG: DUF4173 domain-containing protein [Lachnospiraceae bacterium]|nr:DUF4173 domain-containing protein [Lachnospiraceae bacterium]